MNKLKKIIFGIITIISMPSYATLNLSGRVDDSMLKELREYVVSSKSKEIVVKINSPGGYTKTMFEIVDFIQTRQNMGYRFSIRVEGFCASACFTILQSADYRTMEENARLMQHYPSTVLNIKMPVNPNLSEEQQNMVFIQISEIIKNTIQELTAIKEKMTNIELRKIKLKRKDWINLTSTEYYMDSKKAKELGAVDRVIKP